MFATAALATVLFFTDGKSRYIPVFNQTLEVSKGQCLVDHTDMKNHFFVWVEFATGLKFQAIALGEQINKEKCPSCKKYAVICVE